VSDPYEREAAKAAIKTLQHELVILASKARELKTELSDMRESELRFSKCFERIARAVGIKSPLVLMTMAESDEENYAEILARHIENREKAKESLGL